MDDEPEEKKSRSQKKRDIEELKTLVKQLVALTPQQLRGIPLTVETRDAILDAQNMARAPLNRQLRHLVQRIVQEDTSAIRNTLSGEAEVLPDEAEVWADKLISGDDEALGLFVDAHPDIDRQHLRQLVRNAQKERELDKLSRAAEQLLQYLRSAT